MYNIKRIRGQVRYKMSEHTQAHEYCRGDGISPDAFSHLPNCSLIRIYGFFQESHCAARVCGPGLPQGGGQSREPGISLLFLKETFSKANRLSREAKPSAAEFNVLIKMLKEALFTNDWFVIALSS